MTIAADPLDLGAATAEVKNSAFPGIPLVFRRVPLSETVTAIKSQKLALMEEFFPGASYLSQRI